MSLDLTEIGQEAIAYGYSSVMPSSPLLRGSSAMMCSRDVNTTFPIATMPSLRRVSRMTANAC